MKPLSDLSVSEILALHSDTLTALRDRGVVRSANNPTGDLAEYLFCKTFGWKQAKRSVKAYDAKDAENKRIQIKARRLTPESTSRQLSGFRSLTGFETLAAVLLDEKYQVKRGLLLPAEIVKQKVKPDAHTNSHILRLTDELWSLPDAQDVTDQLRDTLAKL
ncbi:hypothetical protein [Phaeobacter inhibens]|uniref:hypothetical protein n=1 Tax=Phaeobacter inhibens TaxID=221822 RepID=UPI0021A2FFBD|nr:hypothetical protein [Phaeobacter inhibens]UWR62787.1 hypothetical protein K4F88_19400 [Phaeobacter inhibens]